MTDWRPLLFALSFVGAMTAGTGLVLVRGLRPWWALRPVRIVYAGYVFIVLVAFTLWGTGIAQRSTPLALRGIGIAWTVLAYGFPMAVSLLGAAIVFAVARRIAGPGIVEAQPPQPPQEPAAADLPPVHAAPPDRALGRRRLLHGAAATLPALSLGVSTLGLTEARQTPRLPFVPMTFPGLPKDLEGLKILHLTDLHLGYFFHGKDLEDFLAQVAPAAPDLVVFTGDIADSLNELPMALRAAAALKPRLGTFGVVGNHEHFRGIEDVQYLFERSPVDLLLDAGRSLRVGAATLHLTGIDDPGIHATAPQPVLFRRSLARALDGAPEQAFHLLLSHRPDAFDQAEEHRLHLTLSGHTHGGQLGVGGKSAFEHLGSRRYLWGPYARNASQLYVSSGFGHWFPFRIACPTEAPIIVLTGGTVA